MHISESARTRLFQKGKQVTIQPSITDEPSYIAQEFATSLEEGKSVTIEKIVALYTSRDHAISETSLQAWK
ncbi:MAG: hypothetical protein GWN67_04885, partial [Phycisphaerae bacterium]|nr:hypothetical protein [Gammaproteobacteria bacterium]NIU55740.1 hypothetical protein [Phycisphaerae bacterium]NIX57521.1 hypothetical protein [candidate division Zixibacteria bacterium]NIQ75448.1 hypothetical protein [Gammaproteobacteria bacterium]NIR92380.1 hypothetical protein [Gammaproteobacteria bacterium]